MANVQSGGEPVDVPHRVTAAPRAGDGREAHKHGRLLAGLAQEGGGGDVAEVLEARKGAVGSGTAGVDDALWYLDACV